jgi:CCCH-type zinc finger
MNFKKGFLSNKFGIFNDGSDGESLSARSDGNYSDSDTSTQNKLNAAPKIIPDVKNFTEPAFSHGFESFHPSNSNSCFNAESQIHSKVPTHQASSQKNNKFAKKKIRTSILNIYKSLGVCMFFQTDCCNREECPFQHFKLPKQKTHCKFYLQGRCKFGDKCLFYHPTEYLRPLQLEIKKLEQKILTLQSHQMPHSLHVQQLESEIIKLKDKNVDLQNKLDNCKPTKPLAIKPHISRPYSMIQPEPNFTVKIAPDTSFIQQSPLPMESLTSTTTIQVQIAPTKEKRYISYAHKFMKSHNSLIMSPIYRVPYITPMVSLLNESTKMIADQQALLQKQLCSQLNHFEQQFQSIQQQLPAEFQTKPTPQSKKRNKKKKS